MKLLLAYGRTHRSHSQFFFDQRRCVEEPEILKLPLRKARGWAALLQVQLFQRQRTESSVPQRWPALLEHDARQ